MNIRNVSSQIIKKVAVSIDRKITNIASAIRPYRGQFLVVFLVYCLSMLSIWRASFSYMDDLGRAIDGYDWSFEFNRYSSSILAHIFSVNMRLIDVSPWFQIIAVAILSVASLLVAYIVSGWRKPKWPVVIASMFIGLTPFMAGIMLYKFDSVCMAASMLFGLLPVAIWGKVNNKNQRHKALYFVFATICVLFVLTSYQASCGIIIVAAIGAVAAELLRSSKIRWNVVKTLLLKIGILVASCAIACAVFYFVLPSPEGYRSTGLVNISSIIPHIIDTVGQIFEVLIHAMSIEWKVVVALAVLVSILLAVLCSRKKGLGKLFDGFILVIFLIMSIPVSYGIYFLLEEATPLSEYDWGRYLIGCGVALAFFFAMCFAVISSRIKYVSMNAIAIAPVICTLYGFFVFYLALGNGLADQERFIESRVNSFIAMADRIGIDSDDSIQFYGSIGLSPVMKHVQEQYPITRYIIGIGQHGLSEGYWGELRLKRYSGYDFKSLPVQCSDDKQITGSEFFRVYYSEEDDSACVKIL